MIAEIVEAADGPACVEGVVVERKVLALGPGEPAGHFGMTIAAELELGAGDVDAVDGPVGRQEREVLAGADADFEPARGGSFQGVKMLENLHAGAADAALEDQKALLEGAKPDPAGPVEEGCGDAVSA